MTSENVAQVFTFAEQLMRRKDFHHLTDVVNQSQLHRTLDLRHLVSLGVGCVVGAGIFVITGQAASLYAGPALTLSFVLCALPCVLTGLCYGELASMIPIAGSAYSFAGLALGEIVAWFVAMCLTLENLVAAAAVAVGWSASVQALMAEFGVYLPASISSSPYVVVDDALTYTGALINLPAVGIVVLLTTLLCLGVKESANFNNGAVAVKISVLLVFVAYGVFFWSKNPDAFTSNLSPYIPDNAGKFGKYGWSGIFRGAGVVFFANVGFDSICSTAQECINPQRDLPRGLMLTVCICTTLYILVTTALTGMMNYRLLNVDAPVIAALVHVNAAPMFRYLVEVGAIAGLTSVSLVSLMAMPRLILTVAQDGLLPASLAAVHPVRKTPVAATIAAGFLCFVIAGFLPLSMLGELVSFGTLTAFCAVCAAALRLRTTHPHEKREFKAPLFPAVPLLGIASCVAQLCSLPAQTWRNYGICTVIAGLFYVLYSRHHSKLSDRRHSDIMMEEDLRLEDEVLHETLAS